MANFGDFQNGVYADAVRGVNSRYPFDFASIERKASVTGARSSDIPVRKIANKLRQIAPRNKKRAPATTPRR